jgi:hypothetical protein
MSDVESAARNLPVLEWREFLSAHPPGVRVLVDRAGAMDKTLVNFVRIPGGQLELFCDGYCKEVRFCNQISGDKRGHLFAGCYKPRGSAVFQPPWPEDLPYDVDIRFDCEKCHYWVKTYGVRFHSIAPNLEDPCLVEVEKLFETPRFGPRSPAKLFRIGLDRELFLQGRRAESDGLGIGAFAYYRRIVEEHKNQLLRETIRVAEHLSADRESIEVLERALTEIQFSKAMDDVKEAVPRALFIKGFNPFTLLHEALSKGIHAESDEQCLSASADIRIVLTRLAENLSKAMESEEEVGEAVKRIMQKRQDKIEPTQH